MKELSLANVPIRILMRDEKQEMTPAVLLVSCLKTHCRPQDG